MVAACNYKGMVAYHLEELFDNPGPDQYSAINRELWLRIFKETILPHVGDFSRGEENSVIM